MKNSLDYVDVLDDCFGTTTLFDLYFTKNISDKFILDLAILGNLEYLKSFPKPFFRLERKGFYNIKGVLGAKSIRITLMEEHKQEAFDILSSFFKIDKYKMLIFKISK